MSETLLQRNEPATVELPIFPLSSVLFPGGTMALKIFETRYMDMAKACLKNAQPFGIALIEQGNEVGTPASPHHIGTIARIDDWDMPDLGVLRVTVKGESRFKIIEQRTGKNGLIIGIVEMVAADTVSDRVKPESTSGKTSDQLQACAQLLKMVMSQSGQSAEEVQFADASWVSFRVTELLPFSSAIKQKMLELTDADMRLEVLFRFLRDQQLIRV